MRTIERTTKFKKDYKRELKGRHKTSLQSDFIKAIKVLVANETLESKYFDHALSNDWKDHRDCHIKPDLVLIYRLVEPDVLQLVRLGSHSELGL
ncbi:MAG: type II toxin-antitoxin system YafQ family toxin [Mariprofundus sp.]|nr:type II toxin-antitoxin system YafQ family toxin [Mariprofundus sp.]